MPKQMLVLPHLKGRTLQRHDSVMANQVLPHLKGHTLQQHKLVVPLQRSFQGIQGLLQAFRT
ncbi:hypothetical protein A2U01_0050798, partial [Trifolium medium]|nr:hypothetical protein [Trifolium medium]